MIRLQAVLFFGTFVCCLADDQADLRALLEVVRTKHDLPAITGAVFTKDGLVAKASTGVRKRGESEAVTEDDCWHLGSNTKAMTATLTGTFVAEGKLSWDDPMDKFFPDFADKMDASLRKVTITQLLSHRAGLTPNLPWGGFLGLPVSEARMKAAKSLLTVPPASKIGEYKYSNAGYVVVGAVLEKIGGKPWEEVMKDRLFTPLIMTGVGFGGLGTGGKIDQPWGHGDDGKPVRFNGPLMDNAAVIGPAGTVHATTESWTLFLADQLKGASGAKALLPTGAYEAIQSPHPAETDYGLGWIVTDRKWAGGKVLTHSGSNTMNYSVCWLSVPKEFGVLVCTNQAGDHAEKGTDAAAAALITWYQKKKTAQ